MKIVITGASCGIGYSCAMLFLQKGHEVHGIDKLPATIEHPAYRHYIADVRATMPAIEQVQVLITSAGIQQPEEEVLDVNLMGTVRAIERYALQPAIRSVVTIASASATNGAEFPLYAASKGGVVSYTKNLALRLAPYGAVANSLSPGGVLTASNAPVLDDPVLKQAVMDESLLGKWASADEIAEWAYFLAVINRSMTGQDLVIDNGEMLKSNFIWPQ